MSVDGISAGSSISTWTSVSLKSMQSTVGGILAGIPSVSGSALGTSLLSSIYDSNSITPRILEAYWKRTDSKPEGGTASYYNRMGEGVESSDSGTSSSDSTFGDGETGWLDILA